MTALAALLTVCPHLSAVEARPWAAVITVEAARHRLDPVLTVALIREESLCDPNAVHERTKATGLMQLRPQYFAGDLTDPATNIRLGSRYLAWRIKRCRSVVGALSAYNGRGSCRPSVFSARVLRRLGQIQSLRRST